MFLIAVKQWLLACSSHGWAATRGRVPRHGLRRRRICSEETTGRLARRQDDHGDQALGLSFVFVELRSALSQGAEQALALVSCRLARNHFERAGPDLDRDIGVRLEIVVPGGLGRGSPPGGDDDAAPAVAQVAN